MIAATCLWRPHDLCKSTFEPLICERYVIDDLVIAELDCLVEDLDGECVDFPGETVPGRHQSPVGVPDAGGKLDRHACILNLVAVFSERCHEKMICKNVDDWIAAPSDDFIQGCSDVMIIRCHPTFVG